MDVKNVLWGTSLVVHWLDIRVSTAGGTGLIPAQGTKIPPATRQLSLYGVTREEPSSNERPQKT